MERVNPELTDGAYYGPSRGHLQPRWAQHVGMPRGYGYGASMGAWILDYVAGVGRRVGVRHPLHRPVPQPGLHRRRHLPHRRGGRHARRAQGQAPRAASQVELRNQDDAVMAKAEVELPERGTREPSRLTGAPRASPCRPRSRASRRGRRPRPAIGRSRASRTRDSRTPRHATSTRACEPSRGRRATASSPA